MSTNDRVAVVVVHGIADQRPGQTVREVARLLCHGAEGAPPCLQGEIRDVLIPVEKLEPAGGPVRDARPAAKDWKADAPRRQPGTPSGFFQKQQQPAAEPDLGIALNDYLLGRLVLRDADALYESTRVSLRRVADDRAVDIYEMYWADLSRLAAGGLQALSSLYQLFFHLGTLAADVVDQVALSENSRTGWRLLQRLHAWLAWLMKAPIALLQLAMLLMVAFGVAALLAPELRAQLVAVAAGLGAMALAALGALGWLHGKAAPARWAKLIIPLAAAFASVALGVYVLFDPISVPRAFFAGSVLAVAVLGSYLVERYSGVSEGVRLPGHVVVAASAVSLWLYGRRLLPEMTTQSEWMITAALNVGEWLLAAVLLAFGVFAAVQIVALALGLWLGRRCDKAAQASLHTSRLALVGSSSLFVMLSLVLWSVISFVAGRAVPKDILYQPVVFGRGYRSVEIFLEDRLQTFGGFFTPLVLVFGLVAAAALFVLLPSLVEEIRPTRNLDANGIREGIAQRAQRLGDWLTGGVRLLGTVFAWIVPWAAIAGSILYLAFLLEQFALTAGATAAVVAWLAGSLALFQGEALVAVGKWLVGGAVTIAALGSRFTRTFGRLSVAIDAVLDIDNYFADPPNRQPPRARIYSRYASLLAYVRDAGYAHIVIVAHSQGTVISADLLRYLHVQDRLRQFVGAAPVALVTVGSPLRDLYAERFPLLYRWVSPRSAEFANAAPTAADVGASEWVNACRSGDYVGRFLWTPDSAARFGVATAGADGRVQAQRAGDRTEFCLGAGAHTHYFDNDAIALTMEIDRLVAGTGSILERRSPKHHERGTSRI
jgi:hypothetical protein